MDSQQWHNITANEAADDLDIDLARGLDADDVTQRLITYGDNVLPKTPRRSLLRIFFSQFQSPLIYILFAAAIFAFALDEQGDAVVILVVVFVNAIIGAFQEGRAQKSMEALHKLSELEVQVLRDGETEKIIASKLVPGDILLLAAGDAVGADARIIEISSLEASEAALTGESLPVSKQSDVLPSETLLADRVNMLYSGTHITAGRGKAIVVATGIHTEMGKIAQLTEAAESPKTPLELRIAQFGRYLVAGAAALFIAVMSFGLMRNIPVVEIFMVAISQMVSMVPEGLPVAMTIALAVGMRRMAERGAIVRRLAAVETLGSTSVICADKTGTLTRNEMTVTAVWLADGQEFEVRGAGYSPEGAIVKDQSEIELSDHPALRELLEASTLCNDARLVPPDNNDPRWRVAGDPTEAALLTLAAKAGIDTTKLINDFPRLSEIPFDSGIKMMATEHDRHEQGKRIYIKGAPEMILELCNTWRSSNNSTPLDESKRQHISDTAEAFAKRALRILALAEIEDGTIDVETGFGPLQGRATFLGLVGQMDPPRDEVKVAVAECKSAGIRPVMVTGDHKATGLAIARELGIAAEHDRAVDGHELELMPEQDLRADLFHIAVFARVHPAQKLRIVEAFQSRNNVVAMTGDGVNDAPALARADVGVAMGITGTEVAKSASEIVVTDDNFSTIVKAVEEGRLVYRNIKKVILYLFATSMAEITVLLGALLMGYPLPLAAVQILWINIVTEGTVTINLIMEPPEGNEMQRKPVSLGEPLLSKG
ncbi:MAG: haloacid dehalogenase, partial [Gammaproteobacteria bacterium SG8_11]